ncbi:MAG: tRNA (N6-isopentenyl adenosine(37)-C2)-methylthiotransferase MiaB [Cyclobacteriaceae bacterium]|nr:tRNA (N6-isopentenyl adenosine(37)-C2)-methylthiotransferase MiaB [Cyclobacteriaceae bacterium]
MTINTLPVGHSEKENGKGQKLYIESYGCQMNFSDSEIVSSILSKNGYTTTTEIADADIIFLNTCSIRDKAEQTIRKRLSNLGDLKRQNPHLTIGILGCMAERLKEKLLEEEKLVDIIAGPDAYRTLPELIEKAHDGSKAVNTFLSREETYADITPVKLHSNGVTAFISIMRGCDNMCSFCVVPFTRGRERSRDPYSIVSEARDLFEKGFREVTLLGQNVDSYKWSDLDNNKARLNKIKPSETINFSMLLSMVAEIHPDLRIRFSTSNPRDMTDDVLWVMKKYENICNYIHLPVQSGNNRILTLMNRNYTREDYLTIIRSIKKIVGEDCGISSDMIAGFCSETEEEHQDTLSLMDEVVFDFSYMFHYSERPGTPASKNLSDDIPSEVKKKRLAEIIDKQRQHSLLKNEQDIGKTFRVLIEGTSKRSEQYLQGRNSANKVIVFPRSNYKAGEYVQVMVEEVTAATLIGKIID